MLEVTKENFESEVLQAEGMCCSDATCTRSG